MQEAEKLLQKKPWSLQAIFFEHFLRDWSAANATDLAVLTEGNFTQPVKSLSENWSNLSEVIKADTLFVQCLVITRNIPTQQAFQRLAAIKQVLHRLLPLHKGGDLTAIWQGLLLNQQRELITDLSIRKYVSNNPECSYQEAFNYSLPLLKQPTIASPSIVELRLYHLKDILDSWVDWQRAKIQLLNPYQILNAVMVQYERPFPNEVFQQAFAIDKFPNIRFLDEAALLWKQLQKGDMFQGVVENGTFSFSLLENQYFAALSTAYQRQKIMDKMFLQEERYNNSQAIYFNGMALKNAQGKLLNDFINCTELEEISDYSVLLPLQRRSLLQEKFHQIGESEQYEIGSLLHSLASSLQRIYYYQFSALPRYNSQKQLLSLFKHSEEQWRKRKNYPIQPRLLLALHLAESNNVMFSGSDWKVNVKQLFEYLANEFEKISLNPPRFDRVKAAIAILQTQGMSLQEIKQKRYYSITADDANLSVTYFGTPLEQFLKITDWDGVIGKAMYHKGEKIEPRKTLQQAEERFNSQLYQDPWVQNKAIDNLKHAEREVTANAVEQEVKRIVANYKTETENHRAWIRGLKTWVNTIPIVGPLYTMEEGIRDKDPVEVLCGVFFLSLDALDLLAGEGRPEAIELPVRERVTINTLQTGFKKLNLSPVDLPLDDIYITSDPFSISHSNELPAAYELNAAQVRAGRQDLTWKEYPLIYLADEDRVVPVKAEGGSFREINWHTLEVDPKKHLIYKDRESGKYFSRNAGLKGGNPDKVEFTEQELRQRITVKETEEIFKTADNYIKYNFEALFYKCFYLKRFLGASVFDMRSFYRSVYQASPTFRRLFNRFHEVFISEYTGKLWEIRIKPNTITRTDFESNVIHISADAEISAKTYFSSENNFEISHPEQVYLHEMLHALTGKKDPLKIVDIRHRGPIVYLTDKILSEAGYAFPQRIMYRRLTPLDADLEGFELRCKQHREAENLLVAQENEYLDNFIDNALPVEEYKNIFGEELSTRYTIQELNVFIERFLSKPEVSTKVSFEERFLARFSSNKKYMDWLLDFYVNLYIRSDTFYHLFERWYDQLPTLGKRWYFELSDSVARAELPANKQVHAINDLNKKIYIFNDDTLYLTDKGLLPVERTRQLVHEMVQILTGFKDPPADVALKNRGAVVVITDKILNEAIYGLDKRLVYGLAKSSDVAKQAVLLSYQLEASRAAILEDRLLKSISAFQVSCAGCRTKRSSPEKKYLSKMFNSNLALQREDIDSEKKKIQAKLKRYGITQALNYVNAENFNLTDNSNITPSFFYKSVLTPQYNISATNASFFLK